MRGGRIDPKNFSEVMWQEKRCAARESHRRSRGRTNASGVISPRNVEKNLTRRTALSYCGSCQNQNIFEFFNVNMPSCSHATCEVAVGGPWRSERYSGSVEMHVRSLPKQKSTP